MADINMFISLISIDHRLCSMQNQSKYLNFEQQKNTSCNLFQACFAGNNVCFVVDDVMLSIH